MLLRAMPGRSDVIKDGLRSAIGQPLPQPALPRASPRSSIAANSIAAGNAAGSRPDMLAVAGVGGKRSPARCLKAGDLVVASQVTDGVATVSCPSAPLLAGELRRAGLRVKTGPVATVDRLVRHGEHAKLAATGAVAVDMESAGLLAAAAGNPAVVIRAISDTPDHRVLSPRIVTRWHRRAAVAAAGGAGAGQVGRCGRPADGFARQPALVLHARRVERAIEIVELALERCTAPRCTCASRSCTT